MAAKRKRKSPLNPWITVAIGLAIASVAALAVLSDPRLFYGSPVAGETIESPEVDKRHDRDQIDQASRDELREILRAADAGD